ncbi:hypothetical protein [Pseudomonas sp. TE3610]
MTEAEWKLWSQYRPLAVERLYERLRRKMMAAAADDAALAREHFHAVRDLCNEGNEEVVRVFDNFRHSRGYASINLQAVYVRGLLTEDEVASFSEETQAKLRDALAYFNNPD